MSAAVSTLALLGFACQHFGFVLWGSPGFLAGPIVSRFGVDLGVS